MRACTGILIFVVSTIGCIANHVDPPETGDGRAEIRIDTTSPFSVNITRLMVETSGQSQDLVLNPVTGTFDATLVLSTGTHSLVARAFSFDTLVGQSASVDVDIQTGGVTRVLLKILDLTGTSSLYGPIIDSLSYPTSVEAGAPATFTMSAVAPLGAPVAYSWTSDCVDSTFSAPGAATTGWSRPAAGPCTITVSALSSGIFAFKSFVIVVFPVGSASGAVTATGEFLSAPQVQFALPGVHCLIFPDSNDSCPDSIASPDTTPFTIAVFDWGGFSTPGTLELSDNCGGRFGTTSQDTSFVVGNWLPPDHAGVCIVTARAVNADGVVRTASAAILVHQGSSAAADAPVISARLNGCDLTDAATPANCPGVRLGSTMFINGNISWGNGIPRSVLVTDSCAGAMPDLGGVTFFNQLFMASNLIGVTCTTTVQATNLQGVVTQVAGSYEIRIF
jgi:hypothetical protein